MRFIPKRLSEQENANYKGFSGEIVAVPNKGIAVHDGFTPGGMMTEPNGNVNVQGRDNFVRNGNFMFTQNGDEFLGNSSALTYTLDGWFILHNGGSSSNVAQSTTYDPTIESETHATITLTSGNLDSSFSIFVQTYHHLSRFAGKKVTLSYDIKSSVDTSITTEFLLTFQDVGTTNRGTLISRESLTGGVWKKVESTFVVPKISETDVINNQTDNARLLFWLDAGDDWNSRTGGILPFSGTFDIANVKIEEGEKATPYTWDYAEEERKVQEYFEKNSRQQFFNSAATTTHSSTCFFQTSFANAKWTDLPTITFNTSFVDSPSLSGRDSGGFTLLGTANSATSSARVLDYTVDAEIQP